MIPLLSKTQIFSLQGTDLKEVNKTFESGSSNSLDYVIPLCFDNQTFLMKIDLAATALPYFAGYELMPDSIDARYTSSNSLTHGKQKKVYLLKRSYLNTSKLV